MGGKLFIYSYSCYALQGQWGWWVARLTPNGGNREHHIRRREFPFGEGVMGPGICADAHFLAINGARIAADAKTAYGFIARLYEANDFTFEHLAAWLRDHVEPASS